MRPLRLLLSLSTSLVAVILLLYVALGPSQDEELQTAPDSHGSYKAVFSFTSPGSLFPPSAIISLTDDNSTFFLARPAAFGPGLPKHGLSGPLWIGSGFGDDTFGGGGELGCGDVPGWDTDQRPGPLATTPQLGTSHADIQFLQESAEITAKVVLLKRGGCGFLAKVQWAQRRGAVAVIVGDDVRGGALVRMYAKGDTSNITIPSLFTSHTTAHLLSSLLPTESIFQASAQVLPKEPLVASQIKYDAEVTTSESSPNVHHRAGLLRSFLSMLGFASGHANPPKAGSRRLPGSGDLEWIEAGGEWADDQKPLQTKSAASTPRSDGHVIGEQDWRDSDLMSSPTATPDDIGALSALIPVSRPAIDNVFPGSGEYTPTVAHPKTWWKRWVGPYKASSQGASPKYVKTRGITSITGADLKLITTSSHISEPHRGLWVTLTPTNVSTSPFFDTLLVLVVSPLVTLTVVYALLLLRSRIRRRRWRAPKSVVERLPVRTYQTISESSPSATPSASSPTTPLLTRSLEQSTSSTSQPRSTSEPEQPATLPAVQSQSHDREEEKRESGLAAWRRRYGGRQRECVVCLEEYEDGVSQVMSLPCGHEFHAECITPWLVTRRRTCPICKGDVVRSLSQSYHDRLRSSSPTRAPRFFDNVEDLQSQAAETRNDSPSASRPVPISMSAPANFSVQDDDVEPGWTETATRPEERENPGPGGTELSSSLRELSSTVSTVIWRGFDAVRNTTVLQRRSPPNDVDRDR